MEDLVSLSKIFNQSIFRIPDYQRGYAWLEPQLIDFWDDIINLSENKDYYTGMLSLVRLKEETYNKWLEERWIINDKSYVAYHIVDGQQRLTTFIIFISCILKFAEEKGIEYINGESLEEIREKFIVEFKKPERILKAYKFGYEIDNPSFDFLRYKILGEQSSKEIVETFYTLNLENAQKFFSSNLENYFEQYGKEGIESIYKKLVNRLHFNIHYIEDESEVFVAFETMNNRGKKLSNLEILKNRLIYLTTLYNDSIITPDEKEKIRSNINDAWKEVYYQLGRNKLNPLNDDNYLRNHWIMFFKYSRTTGDDYIKFLLGEYFTPKAVYSISAQPTQQYEMFKEMNDDESETDDDLTDVETYIYSQLKPSDINDYVDSLKNTAQYWYYSYNPKEADFMSEEEKEWTLKLNRIGINYFRPLVAASFAAPGINKEERITLFKAIEKFIFVLFRMAGYQSTYQSSVYYRYARELLIGEKTIKSITDELEQRFETEKEAAVLTFITRIGDLFKNKDGYFSWKGLRYLLFEYEQSLREKTSVEKLSDWSSFIRNDKDHVSIEHIYPQKPTKWYWRNQFRDYSNEEKRNLTGSIGNLLALSQSINSVLQNSEYEDKKNGNNKRERGYYNGSNSEVEVANKYLDWNPQAILDRGLNLLKYFETRWDLVFPESRKYEILGLSFMLEPRLVSPELEKPKEIVRGKETGNYLTTKEAIEEFLSERPQHMVDLYNELYKEVSIRIDGLYEIVTDKKVYIAFREEVLNQNIAEIRIQQEQIRINIHEPTEERLKIHGKPNKENYRWVLEYNVYLKEETEIPIIADAILDSFLQMI